MDPSCSCSGALASALPYGPQVAEHCVLLAGLQHTRKPKAQPLSDAEAEALFKGTQQWQAWLDACEDKAPEGVILLKPAAGGHRSMLPAYHQTCSHQRLRPVRCRPLGATQQLCGWRQSDDSTCLPTPVTPNCRCPGTGWREEGGSCTCAAQQGAGGWGA